MSRRVASWDVAAVLEAMVADNQRLESWEISAIQWKMGSKQGKNNATCQCFGSIWESHKKSGPALQANTWLCMCFVLFFTDYLLQFDRMPKLNKWVSVKEKLWNIQTFRSRADRTVSFRMGPQIAERHHLMDSEGQTRWSNGKNIGLSLARLKSARSLNPANFSLSLNIDLKDKNENSFNFIMKQL